jgi:glycerol-3-phosphate O-acyltransferase
MNLLRSGFRADFSACARSARSRESAPPARPPGYLWRVSDARRDSRFPMPQVEPDLRQWPLYRLTRDAAGFHDEVVAEALQALSAEHADPEALARMLATTLYHEKIRLTRKPWSTDPPDEKPFWRGVEKELTALEPDGERLRAVTRSILDRYVAEMQGSFHPGTYRFARQFLPVMFNRLLNASDNRNFSRVFGNRLGIHDRVHIDGNVERIRQLVRDGGTLVVMPTHFSNLDSILIGYALDAVGLPAFLYGAGLNLFSARILAYFMNRLGAYKLDRRKKNRVYLTALKTFSTRALERGTHTLFFPGGTRSRGGMVESQLKLGLMGTVVDAQRRLLMDAGDGERYRKLYVVPLNIAYNFVLEAPVLIRDHLQAVGRERFFVEQDRYSSSGKIARFILRFFTTGSDIRLRFGDPMDVLGNPIDAEGHSLDPAGRRIALRHYFSHLGTLTEDAQRDQEYTRILGERVVDALHRHNTVMATHVVAFAAFELLRKRHPDLDLYQLLRLPPEDRRWDRAELEAAIARLGAEIDRRCAAGALFREPKLDEGPPAVLRHGIRNLGIYHDQRALREHRKHPDAITSDDLSLLFYYHNRLEGYELQSHV